MLTLNTNQMHFNGPYAARTRFGRQLVNSTLTLALITGMSVRARRERPRTSPGGHQLPAPVFVGDTLWAESDVLGTRDSASQPTVGIVSIRSRGVNQRGEVVIEFRRTFMAYRRDAPEAAPLFPEPTTGWTV